MTNPRALIKQAGGRIPVAKALGLTPQAVGKWCRSGIPDAHRAKLEEMAGETKRKPPEKPQEPIAARLARDDLRDAEKRLGQAKERAAGLPPVMPVRWYGLWLMLIVAIELPVMARAFVMLSDTVMIMAVCAAIGATGFLIIGAHAVGMGLRHASDSLPAWVPQRASLLAWSAFVITLSAQMYDLRSKGIDAEQMVSSGGAIFGSSEKAKAPDEAVAVLVSISGSIMVAGTLLATVLSYLHCGPQASYARAWKDYRRKIMKLERVKG